MRTYKEFIYIVEKSGESNSITKTNLKNLQTITSTEKNVFPKRMVGGATR